MRQAVLSLAVILALAVISPVRGQTPAGLDMNVPARTTASSSGPGSAGGFAAESDDAVFFPADLAQATVVARVTEEPEADTLPSTDLEAPDRPPSNLPAAQWTPGPAAPEYAALSLIGFGQQYGPLPQARGARPMFFDARLDKVDPAESQPANLRVSGVFTYKYTDAPTPSVTDGENYNGPGADSPTINELSLELGMTLTLGRNVSAFADLNTDYTSDSGTVVDIERLYLDAHDIFGVSGLGFRIGRDAIRLGPTGLLLEEVLHDDDRRDGIQVWLPRMGPITVFGLLQYALEDWSTTRRVWAGRAEAPVFPGWTLGLNIRGDTASAADAGPCPSIDCATGSGVGVDLEGTIAPGVGLTMSYASYTQTADVARSYYQATLTFDMERLAGMQRLAPLLTLWYKNFDPYTIPGGDGSVPRGGFLTPDDFHLFNVNDNLTAVGSRLDLQLLQNVSFFALGEWGTYKNSGPTYNVYSAGLRLSFPSNIIVKLAYNAYTVAGGAVTTSPISGIELSNARLWEVELTKSW